MKNIRLIIPIIAISLFSPAVKAQDTTNSNTNWIEFSTILKKTIYKDLETQHLDSNNFVGFYMIKVTISATQKIDNYQCSTKTPNKLCMAIKNSLEKCILSINKSNALQGLSGKTLLIPFIIDYESNVKKGLQNIAFTDLANVMTFDQTLASKRSSAFSFTGVPIEGIILDPIIYQTEHFNSTPVNKFRSKE